MTDLDPKLTFDSFVVGPANRLASAAARRAAESPGTSYNPLFIYSASGLGKSHILNAIAHHARKVDENRRIEYMALEGYLEELTAALESGSRDAFRDRYGELEILLLDDVQFLTGQAEAQEMLLRTLDQLSSAGSQIVLASDRPPADINGLDARLLSRFSGGLIVDIAAPEFETRVAIIRKKAEERGQSLGDGVGEALARVPFRNIRELGGALNKVFATQDLEERQVNADEVPNLISDMEAAAGNREGDEFDSFLDDLSSTVAATVEAQEDEWRKAFREAVDAAEREGYSAERLKALQGGPEPEDWQGVLDTYRDDVRRLREIESELDRLGNPWPDLGQGVMRDPERLEEAETLLKAVQERQRPFPRLGEGRTLDDLADFPKMAVKAAHQLVAAERPEYNPLYVWSEKPELARTLLGAAGRSYQRLHPEARMAVTSVQEFAEDFIRALGGGVAGAWRERWWTVDLLMVHGVEALSETERAQDEFFHLFEALKRRGARVMLVADRAPVGIIGIDERLRSRFEGGLVVEVDAGAAGGDLELVDESEEAPEGGLWGGEEPAQVPPLEEIEVGDRAGLFPAPGSGAPSAPAAAAEPQPAPRPEKKTGAWFPSPENVVLHWPRIQDLLQEELD